MIDIIITFKFNMEFHGVCTMSTCITHLSRYVVFIPHVFLYVCVPDILAFLSCEPQNIVVFIPHVFLYVCVPDILAFLSCEPQNIRLQEIFFYLHKRAPFCFG